MNLPRAMSRLPEWETGASVPQSCPSKSCSFAVPAWTTAWLLLPSLTLVKGFGFVSVLALSSLFPGAAHGEIDPVQAPAASNGIDGLPGLYRVPVAAEPAPRVGAGLWFSYGYTEAQKGYDDPQDDAKGSHHRLGSTASVGGALWPYLALAMRLDVRHDLHPPDEIGKDSGTLIDWTPLLRFGMPFGAFRIGGEARFLFAGATGGGKFPGPTPEGRLLLSYVDQGWYVSGFAGYRTPFNGHNSIPAEDMRAGDRVALGVSEYAAVMSGLGVMKQLSSTALFGEVTWDILVGKGAPSVAESPLRVALGVAQTLLPGFRVHGLVEIAPGQRAPSLPPDPLVPIEPRVSAVLGLSVSWPEVVPRRPAPAAEEKEVESKPETPPAPLVVVPPQAPKARLLVEVLDETEHPISDAHVSVSIPERGETAAHSVDIPLKELNKYLETQLEPGTVELSIEADLLQSYTQQIELLPDQDNVVQVRLRKTVGLDGQLRGLVRSYSGVGVQARVRVEPGGKSVACSSDGEFELELPPGNYSVIIEAEGYSSQKRPVRIRKDGVTVLNADLHQSK